MTQDSGQARAASPGAASDQAVTGSQPLAWSGTEVRRRLPGDVGEFTVEWQLPSTRGAPR